jgi:molecular chaperone IbpA
MTKTLTLRSFDIPTLTKFGIGFDNMFDELMRVSAQQSSTNYPPYDIVQINDDEYVISVAVAGFGQDDLSVVKDKKFLIIEGKHYREEVEEGDYTATTKYLHKGISERSFRREFQLADHVEIGNAHLELGILSIHLTREVPEEAKPRSIAITHTSDSK